MNVSDDLLLTICFYSGLNLNQYCVGSPCRTCVLSAARRLVLIQITHYTLMFRVDVVPESGLVGLTHPFFRRPFLLQVAGPVKALCADFKPPQYFQGRLKPKTFPNRETSSPRAECASARIRRNGFWWEWLYRR